MPLFLRARSAAPYHRGVLPSLFDTFWAFCHTGHNNKVCSALDPDKGTELELTVYTLTVHDGGVNQGLCAESKMYIDDLRVKGGVILGRGWEVHVFFVSAQRCGCAVAPPGAAFCPGCMLFL